VKRRRYVRSNGKVGRRLPNVAGTQRRGSVGGGDDDRLNLGFSINAPRTSVQKRVEVVNFPVCEFWSAADALMSAGGELMSGASAFMSAGSTFRSGGRTLMSAACKLMPGASAFRTGARALMSGACKFMSRARTLMSGACKLMSGARTLMSAACKLMSAASALMSADFIFMLRQNPHEDRWLWSSFSGISFSPD
jgi:hypothetical protein